MSEKKFSLYELNGLYLQILNEGGEWDPEALRVAMESITDSIEVKLENYAKIIRHFQAEAKMIKDEEERLAARRKSLENKVKYLKESMQLSMELTGTDKVKSSLFTIYLSSSQPPVEITNEKQLLKKYKTIEIKVDKKSLMADLKAGKTVRGAKLGVASRSLTIK